MLNTVNLCRFVTLTLRHFVTPQQVRHGLVVDSERYVFESLSLCHAYSMAQLRAEVNRQWTVCLLALNRQTDALRY